MTQVWDWGFAWSVIPDLLHGLVISVYVTILGSILAFILGLAWTFLRLWRVPFVSIGADLITQFLRGTPFLVQLYFLFYALPQWGISLSPIATGIIGIGLFNSAFATEVYRAGIENVPSGQWEACLVLGLPLRRVWFGIVLPQTARLIVPLLGNITIAMFKETSVLSTITVFEMLAQAMDKGFTYFRFLEPLTMAGLIYLAVSYVAACGIRRLEHRHALG